MDIKKIYESIVFENNKIDEAGLELGNQAYPKSDQILIMAGGAGSGKSFILNHLLLFEGKTLNPDNTLITMVHLGAKYPESSISRKFKKATGKEFKDIDLKNSEDVNLLYDFVSDLELHSKLEWCFFNSVSSLPENYERPNVIFDVQMRNLETVDNILELAEKGKYKPENIHVVWVLNEFKTAYAQNLSRDRKIDPTLLKDYHIGVAETFNDLIVNTDEWKDLIGGDIWIVFNKKGVDIHTVLTVGNSSLIGRNKQKVTVNLDPDSKNPYFAVQLKEKGKPAKSWKEINTEILRKIRRYVPKDVRNLF